MSDKPSQNVTPRLPTVAVEVALSAKAELTGNIPEHAVGRLAHALADALSPLTEGLGLVGDALRTHRTALVIKRAENTHKLLRSAGRTVRGAPLKFIAPWAEAASIEEDNSELNTMWEHLLANASTSYEVRYNNYVDILKRMSTEEAKFINSLCAFGQMDVTFELDREWLNHVKGSLRPILEGMVPIEIKTPPLPEFSDVNQMASIHLDNREATKMFDHEWHSPRIVALFTFPTFQILPDRIESSGFQYYYRPGLTENIYAHQNLIREGLLYKDTTEVDIIWMGHPAKCKVWFLQATEIGVDLVRVCNTVLPEKQV